MIQSGPESKACPGCGAWGGHRHGSWCPVNAREQVVIPGIYRVTLTQDQLDAVRAAVYGARAELRSLNRSDIGEPGKQRIRVLTNALQAIGDAELHEAWEQIRQERAES